MTIEFQNQLTLYRDRVNIALEHAILSFHAHSSRLIEAMRYSTLNGGKRLRPILVYAIGHYFEKDPTELDTIAAAIECIHCYSLIHDDLPAMDDDELRRGQPTCHIAFDEATAILAGDALQGLAFKLLSEMHFERISQQLKLIQILSKHSLNMIDGQSLDLCAEGKKLSVENLTQIHSLKTADLIRASVLMGAVGSGCEDDNTLKTLDEFALALGLAFQCQDDLLDMIGNSKKIGKKTGQDKKLEKATYAIMVGPKKTKEYIQLLIEQALSILKVLPKNTDFLEKICLDLLHRKS